MCRACQRFPRPERARGKGPGPPSTAPASRNNTCVASASVSRGPSARAARVQGLQVPRLPAETTRVSRRGPGPLSTEPASTNDACVAPASVSRGPSARAARVQGLSVPRLPAQTTRVSRLSAFPAARERARQRSRASKYRACQHKRRMCRACQRFPRPERARGKGPGPPSTAPASRHVCRVCQRFPRPERARGKDPGPLSTAPASTNDACVAPASVSRGPSARAARVQGL